MSRQIIVVVLAHTLAGPVVGGLGFALVAFIWFLIELTNDPLSVAAFDGSTLLYIAQFVGIFSFVLGIIPALLSGLVLGLRTWLRGTYARLEAALAAFAATGATAAFAVWLSAEPLPAAERNAQFFGTWVFLAPLGIAAALVLRAGLSRLGWLPRKPVGSLAPAKS